MRKTTQFFFEYFGIKYLLAIALCTGMLLGVLNFDFFGKGLNGFQSLDVGLYTGCLIIVMYVKKSLLFARSLPFLPKDIVKGLIVNLTLIIVMTNLGALISAATKVALTGNSFEFFKISGVILFNIPMLALLLISVTLIISFAKSKITYVVVIFLTFILPGIIGGVAVIFNEKLLMANSDTSTWIFISILYFIVFCVIVPCYKISVFNLKRLEL